MSSLHKVFLAAVIGVSLVAISSSTAKADDYWNTYWGWYDNDYSPYYHRYYRSNPYSGRYSYDGYYGRSYDPYYGSYYGSRSYDPYYGGYYNRGTYVGTPGVGYYETPRGTSGVNIGGLQLRWR